MQPFRTGGDVMLPQCTDPRLDLQPLETNPFETPDSEFDPVDEDPLDAAMERAAAARFRRWPRVVHRLPVGRPSRPEIHRPGHTAMLRASLQF